MAIAQKDMILDKIYKWEDMSLTGITTVMVKWLNFHAVEISTKYRHNVESGIWYDLTIKDDAFNYLYNVSAQSSELLKARLIEYLDKKEYRAEWLKEKKTALTP